MKATAQMAESADYELAGFLGFDAQFCSTMADFVHWPVDPGIGEISIKTRDTKLERFLHKNQHTQRKLLNFENWTNGEPQ